MCHLRSADLQPQLLIKLQFRDRLCIRTCGVQQLVYARACGALYFPHRDARHPLQAPCIEVQKLAHSLRKYHHPLPHCHCRKHMLHHVRGRLHHSPCVAARTRPAPLARIHYQKVLAGLFNSAPAQTGAPECHTPKTSAGRTRRVPAPDTASFRDAIKNTVVSFKKHA